MGQKRNAGHHAVQDPSKLLQSGGLKVTKPRLALLAILTQEHGPFTAEELHAALNNGRNKQRCDVVTVYRCLAKFESVGIISRCDFGDGSIRYELSSHDHHHHHIICRSCKKVQPLHDCPVDDKSIKLPKTGYRDVSHRLEFFGICPDCHSGT